MLPEPSATKVTLAMPVVTVASTGQAGKSV